MKNKTKTTSTRLMTNARFASILAVQFALLVLAVLWPQT